jgi:hypothetical protein
MHGNGIPWYESIAAMINIDFECIVVWLIMPRDSVPGFLVSVFPVISAKLDFLFPGKIGRESRELNFT